MGVEAIKISDSVSAATKKHGSFFTAGIQPKLTINKPGDLYEQEADRVAEKIMHTDSISSPNNFFAPSLKPSVQRKCAACEEEEISRKESSASNPMVTPAVRSVLSSPGQALDTQTRNFMEAKFGHEFGEVRIHNDSVAHQSSADISAKAYTNGNHIVFGAGEYNPSTNAGKHLLAHELTHVIQQNSEMVKREIIQRAKIPYRPITIADFQAKPPASSSYSAEISSGFDVPGFSTSPNYKITGERCTTDDKKASKMVVAKQKIDPVIFDSMTSYMDTEASWIRDRFKDNGVGYCKQQAKKCELDFDQSIKSDNAICESKAKECAENLKGGRTGFRFQVGKDVKDVAVANTKSDCSYFFLERCKELHTKNRKVSLGTIVAKNKGDCSKTFQTQCQVSEITSIKDLLRHEQGHFDITDIIAAKARSSLKAKTAKEFTAKGCGQDKAEEQINILIDEVKKLGTDWQAKKEQAQNDYDFQTTRGSIADKQKIWETKIKDGLKEYDIGATTTTTPPTTTKQPKP